jgi:hypothetical protein
MFVAVFAWNLLTTSRERAWGDAQAMWEVAERMVSARALDIEMRWPEDIPAGRGGKYYGIAPIGPSLVHVPGVVIEKVVHAIAPRFDPLVLPFAVHLAPAALGALACVLLFLFLDDLGISRRTASATVAIFAGATTAWVYARSPYSEILQLAAFLGLVRQVLRTADAPTRGRALALGAWAGVALNAKYVFALAIVGGLVIVAWSLRHRRGELLRALAWTAAAGAPFALLALAYNAARWGSITASGYEPYFAAYFGGSAFDGAWGMLASPNKSVFLYSPPLVLAVIAWPAAIRAVPRLAGVLIAMVAPVFVVYATYRSWSGEYAWGSRFFVWATPVVLVPLAWWLDAAVSRWRRAITLAVVGAGVCVQLLGNALYWDHYIRIAIIAKDAWLGQPDRRGAFIAERGRGHCDSCFEDTYELLWTPAFQPIRGHWWLVRALAAGDTAASAEADAPWHTYTTLPLPIDAGYERVRLDSWWAILDEAPATWPVGVALGAGLTVALAWALRRWRMRLSMHVAQT